VLCGIQPNATNSETDCLLQVSPSAPAKSIGRTMRARGRWVAAGVVALAVSAGVAWWSARRAAPVHYVTVPAARGPITRTVTATGTVNPVLTIIVGTYVSGVIQNIYCDYNTQVRAGQVCAKIDPRPYQATLDQYSGQLLRDQAVQCADNNRGPRACISHSHFCSQLGHASRLASGYFRGPRYFRDRAQRA
jgi:HlyD family secretion protein